MVLDKTHSQSYSGAADIDISFPSLRGIGLCKKILFIGRFLKSFYLIPH